MNPWKWILVVLGSLGLLMTGLTIGVTLIVVFINGLWPDPKYGTDIMRLFLGVSTVYWIVFWGGYYLNTASQPIESEP